MSSLRSMPLPFRAAAVIAAALTIALAVWLQAGVGGVFVTKVVDDSVEVLAALASTLACVWATRRRPRAERRAWGLLCAASACWFIGSSVWTVLEVFLRATPFPSLADPFYLGFVPFAAAALVAFAGRSSGGWWRLRLLLDGLIAATATLFVSWALLLGSVYDGSSTRLLERVLTVAYPAGDVIVVAMVLIVAAHARHRKVFGLIASGMLMLVVADTSFGYESLKGSSGPGPLNALWAGAFLMVALAALSPEPADPRNHGRRERLAANLLPCAPVPVAIAVLVVRVANGGKLDPFLAWLGVSAVTIILVRQVVALVELARGLEVKVRARTEELGCSEDRFRSLLLQSSDAVLVLASDLTITYATEPAEWVLGRRPEDLVGKAFSELVDPSEWPHLAKVLAGQMTPGSHATSTEEVRIRGPQGAWMRSQTVVANLLDNPNVGGLVLTIRDVTPRRALEDQLRELAFHDSLTGLPNRALFRDRVEHALEISRRTHRVCGVLFVDLDNFKRVNDTLGHAAGDQLLEVVALRIQDHLRTSDTVARLGGDEFAVLSENTTDPGEAAAIAGRLLAALQTPIDIAGQSILATASIGVATTQSGAETVDGLLGNADIAMYAAKHQGGGCFKSFAPEMHTAAVARLRLEEDLGWDVEGQEFVVHTRASQVSRAMVCRCHPYPFPASGR